MATVVATSLDTVATAASTIADLDAKLQKVVAYVDAEKTKIKSALNAHIAAHAATIAAHQKEVDAASALIATASPATPAKADDAAAIILTSSTQVQGVVEFLGKNWRYIVAGVLLVVAFAGYHYL